MHCYNEGTRKDKKSQYNIRGLFKQFIINQLESDCICKLNSPYKKRSKT